MSAADLLMAESKEEALKVYNTLREVMPPPTWADGFACAGVYSHVQAKDDTPSLGEIRALLVYLADPDLAQEEQLPLLASVAIGSLQLASDLGVEDLVSWVEFASDLATRKHADYGEGNIASFGIPGIAVRAHDKVCRIENLLTKGVEPENESLLDSVVDLHNYAVIGIMLIFGYFTLPIEGD